MIVIKKLRPTLSVDVFGERVDFDKGAVALEEEVVELDEDVDGLIEAAIAESHLRGDLFGGVACESLGDVHRLRDDRRRIGRRHLLDVNAAFR